MPEISSVHVQATERLNQLQPAVDKTKRHVESNTVRYLDEPERIQLRVDRLVNNPLIARNLRGKGVLDEFKYRPVGALSEEATNELERTIGGADYMPVWFLSRGAEIRRTVGRVRARTRANKEYSGTGFLIAPRLLLTNHHVLDWTDTGEEGIEEIVDSSLVEFDFEEQFDGLIQTAVTFRLQPDTLLLLNPWHKLDYVLVAVEPRALSNQNLRLDDYGFNRITAEQGKVSKGEPVFVIQHPNNQPKKVVFQSNRLIERTEEYVAYEADTDTGSSGAPVYNAQWEVVALHHATQIARDDQGRILARDGGLWSPEMGSRKVKFLNLNEGVRISRVIANLNERCKAIRDGAAGALDDVERCTAEGRELLQAALQFREGVPPVILAGPADEAPRRPPENPRGPRIFSRPD
jgi:endonuclease G